MLTHASFRPALVVGVVIAATAWFATRAGDLNPPKGPVQPTMVSLEDLYNRIGTQQNCPECVWQYKYVSRDVVGDAYGQLVTGSGVLHAVMLPGNTDEGSAIKVYDWVYTGGAAPPAQATIGQFQGVNANMTPTVLGLDVRFTNGIAVGGLFNSSGTGGIAVLYRLDP